MKSELYSLSRLFTETLFRIPDYQRGYAWTKKQLKDFWNDIEQLEVGKNHYTGVLTLEEVPASVYEQWEDDRWIIKSKRYQPLYVVDGQQRLTTAMVLVQAILERLADTESLNYTSKEDIKRKFIFESRDGGISRSYLFGYEKDNPSYEYLKQLIFLERSDSHSLPEDTIYTKNLHAAKKFFCSRIEHLNSDGLESVYRKLTQQVLFNIYVIANEIDVFVTFETMNNRGKRLSRLELLKNRLIYLSTKLPDEQAEKDKLRRTINESWKTVYHYLGRNQDSPLDDDLFLDRHFELYFGLKGEKAGLPASASPGGAAFSSVDEPDFDDSDEDDYLLDRHFTVRNVLPVEDGAPPDLGLSDLYEYAHHIKNFVKIYYDVLNPMDPAASFTKDEVVVLGQISRIATGRSEEFLLVLAVVLAKKGRGGNALRMSVLKVIERLLFARSIVQYLPGFEEKLDCKGLAINLLSRRIELGEIDKILRDYLGKYLAKADVLRVLTSWSSKPLGYYQWRAVKYFMFEYEQKLRASTKDGREKLHWQEFLGDSRGRNFDSVEHIYPRKASDPYWASRFKVYSVSERNCLKNSIGNLLPISRPKNASLSNKSFLEKRGSEASKVGYAYGCYAENEVGLSAEWNAMSILERGVRLLSFLEERWAFALGSRTDKIKTLRLDFVLRKSGAT